MIATLARYFAAILQDGDFANDWLTHLPRAMRQIVRSAGMALATILDSTPYATRQAASMVGDLLTCADPTLPSRYYTALLPLARALAKLYDTLLSLGVC